MINMLRGTAIVRAHARLCLPVLVTGLLAAGPANAQEFPSVPVLRSDRPYHGLFQSQAADVDQSLTVTLNGGGGADRAVPSVAPTGDGVAPIDPFFGSRSWGHGGYALGSAQGQYTLHRERVDVGASMSVWSQYYGHDRGGFLSSEGGVVSVSARPFQRTTLMASQSATRQPYTLLSLMPGLFEGAFGSSVLADPNLAIDRTPYTSYTTLAGVTQEVRAGRRDSFTLDYTYMRSDANSSRVLLRTWQSHAAGGGYRHGWTRDLGYHVGYHYHTYTYPQGRAARFEAHDVDLGVDLDHAFSRTRRTRLVVSSGTAAYSTAAFTRYDVIGNAQLTREIGRTWTVFGGYRRNVEFIDTLDVPVRFDGIDAGVGGLITPRLQFESTVRGAVGTIGFTSAGNAYRTVTSTATLTEALTRWLAIAGSYSYYRYALDGADYVPAGTFLQMNRQVLRVYLTAWVPALEHHSRRRDAAR